MKIAFSAKTNKDYCMINTATFTMPDGTRLTIDRESTCYDIADDVLSMEWRGCYLWKLDDEDAPDDDYAVVWAVDYHY